MVKFTTNKLRLITKNRGIKNYQNMSKEKLLSTLDELECVFENLSQNGLERIAKIDNLSQNNLKEIAETQGLSQNKLEQISKMKLNKNYKSMSKERLLIPLLKSGQSHTELSKSKSNNSEIQEIKNFLIK